MCGIAGICSVVGIIPQNQIDAVRRMTRSLRSRGPDAEGFWKRDNVAFGHRRLAILDLDRRADQPMLSSDNRFCITFNGEIYNFRELRRDLEAKGETFRTSSDTEVLLSLYAWYGPDMLPKLRGMFAFAIWDSQSRELFMARDPYGIKPLYYAATRSGLIFASQVKAILASGLVDREMEPAALAGFYLWGSVPEPWTLYRGLLALPAGTWMRAVSGVAQKPVCWHDIGDAWRVEQEACSAGELQERVRHRVTESVRAHLVSDVPVSAFLSGGVDSGTLVALCSEMGAKIEGITISFKEFEDQRLDEAPLAAQIAARYDVPHHIRPVSRAEFEEEIPRFIEAMDQPTIDGVNSWFACKAAAEQGYKVVLSGLGGDELLYGYSIARDIPRGLPRNRAVARIPGVRRMLRGLFARVPQLQFHPKLKGVPVFMGSVEGEYFLRRSLFLPQELSALMGEEQAREGLHRLGGSPPGMQAAGAVNGGGAICLLDSTLYMRNQLLRDSDWTSMAFSLELRTPLVDATLLQSLSRYHAKFINGNGKRMLAMSPRQPLPDSIINRPKTGFAVPMTQWLAAGIGQRSWASSALLALPGTPWTRRWSHFVMEAFVENNGSSHLRREEVV
ncbi:MAG TPA: asparagine synthase (glutamine-hydrolyzing) [Terracidiphilus sp.]|jgi:asparagine synthase (glutamine-hydrolysing)